MATSQGNTPYDLAFKGDLQSLKIKIKEDPELINKKDAVSLFYYKCFINIYILFNNFIFLQIE